MGLAFAVESWALCLDVHSHRKGASVNKADLIEAVAGRVGADKKAASNAVEAVIDVITRAVAEGQKVAISGFGVFEKIERGARTARNPATGAIVKLKKTHVPKFRAGTQFKEVVSGAKKLAKAAPAVAKSTATKAAKATTKKAAPAKKAAAKKSPAKKAPAKATAKKSVAKKSPAKKAPAKKTTAKKTAKKATKR